MDEEKQSIPLFAYRKFTSDGYPTQAIEYEHVKQSHKLIVDGQQRLQSFYIGLIGTYEGKQMYFDLYSDFANSEYDFNFAENIAQLPKKNADKPIKECLWYPVQELFLRLKETSDSDQVSEEIISTLKIKDDVLKKAIDRNINIFDKSIFREENIGLSSVSINKSKSCVENRQRIVELFRRLNDGGTKLSSFDLVASVLKGFDYRMETFLDEVVEKYKDIGVSQDTLIKLLFILNDQPQKEMANIEAKDAKFATDNRERIEYTLVALKKFLEFSKLYNYFHSEKNRSFIPLYFIAYHIFKSTKSNNELKNMFDNFDTKDADFNAMKKWICISLLNGVFSRGRGWIPYKTGIRKLHEVIQRANGKSFPTDKIFEMYENHPLIFKRTITSISLDQFDKEAIFYMLYDGMATLRSEDIDHIHPKSLLEKLGYEPYKINSIINYQLLESGVNRGEKSNKELKIWIENFVEQQNHNTYLDRHLIPVDSNLWMSSNYDAFKVERAKLIVNKLEKWCN